MSAFDAYLKLTTHESEVGRVVPNEPMSKHTTFRIGGPATAYVTCETPDQLAHAIDTINACDSSWIVIGNGSNLLVADRGYEGIVISLAGSFNEYSIEPFGVGTSAILNSGAGVMLNKLVKDTFESGWSGMEFGMGIPGTLGGAVFMNAGTKDATIGDRIISVTVLRPGRGLHKYEHDDLLWIYRYSGIPTDEEIIGAELSLDADSPDVLQAKLDSSLMRRKMTQPQGQPNAGSIFRNPVGDSAGRLIDMAGLKGYSCGGAQVSEVHANFIVNKGNATAEDVMSLVETVRDRVRELNGIELQTEIKFLGFAS